MSVRYYDYICPKCGHVEKEQGEGVLLFGDLYHTVVCKTCKKVITKDASSPSICKECGSQLESWDERCPKCDTPMEKKICYSIII